MEGSHGQSPNRQSKRMTSSRVSLPSDDLIVCSFITQSAQSKRISRCRRKTLGLYLSVGTRSDFIPSPCSQHRVWELAVAVRATSELDNKERLGSMLKELGDMTRDVKDSMTSLNAKGINAFTWIMHEVRGNVRLNRSHIGQKAESLFVLPPFLFECQFTRIEKTIELIQSKSGRYQVEDVSRQLDGLFQHIARDLSSLVNDIEVAIPLAKRASELGEIVMFDLSTEHARLNRAKEDTPLWRRLKDMNSFAAKQLRRDLRLCQDSVVSLSNTRRGLEEARGFLVGYRDQGGSPMIWILTVS